MSGNEHTAWGALVAMNQRLAALRASGADNELRRWQITMDDWMHNDPLGDQVRSVPRLFAEGEVTWGQIVIANHLLWEPGPANAPGSIVYSFDPYVQRHPDWLQVATRQIGTLRSQGGSHAWPLQAAAADISDDYARSQSMRVPPALTMGRVAFLTAMQFERGHIPLGRVCGVPFPVVAFRGSDRFPMMLPGHLWAPWVLQRWEHGR